MRPTLKIRGLRGSMFMPQLRLSNETLNSLWELLQGWVPSVVDPNMNIRNGVYITPNPWMLASPDGKERLVFTPQKVDYLFLNEGEYTIAEMSSRLERCALVFGKILSIANVPTSRLAFAPAFVLGFNENEYKAFIAEKMSNSQFKGRSLEEANFTQTFFVEEEIGDTYLWINYLSKFETERYVDNVDGQNQILSRYTLEFDINTRENNSVSFFAEDVAEFYNNAIQLGESYLDYYFS